MDNGANWTCNSIRQATKATHLMATNLDGQLVVAISSRALFDLEEENQVFEQSDDRAYMKLQLFNQ